MTDGGYVECPACHKHFWISIEVEGDRIVGFSPNPGEPGFK